MITQKLSRNALGRLTAFFLALAFVRAHGADFYVSTQGNDSNPGTSAQPFRTITRAYSLASPGVTITVMPGVYTDYSKGWGLHLGASGTASSPITLRSQVRGGAVIDGQNLSDRNKGIYLDGSYNVVDGFEIRGGPNGGISIWGNSNQILNNEIHHNGNPASTSTNGKDGVYSSESTRDNGYRANYIHDNGRLGSNLDHGLYLCGDNEIVFNNVLVRNAATGLQIAGYTTVSNMRVYNNVVAFNGTSGIILWQALSGVDIKNNIIFQNGSYGINSWDAHGSGVVIDRNLLFGNGSGDFNFINGGSDYSYTRGTTISAAPLFVNSTSAGFDPHLAAGSPAISAGLNLSSFFTTDKDGAARSASGPWDLGAYRYGSSDTTPPTISLSSPASGASVSGSSVSVSANASDNVDVTGVQFKLDGANLGVEDTSAPYSVTWNTTTMANGSHTLSAVARDAAGNQATATAVSVLVNNIVNTAPTISNIANQTINAGTSTAAIAFTVSDAETAAGSLTVSGLSSNPTLVPSGNIVLGGLGSNRTVTATPAANQTGTATITLTVSDGALSRSTSFVLTVNALSLPVVTLTTPANGTSYTAPASINLAASVIANGHTITKVQFFSGTVLLAETATAPYSFAWGNVGAGNYSLSARAVYDAGSTVVSSSASVAVASAPPPSSGLTFAATSGTITAPFITVGGIIYQTAFTSLTGGGRAAYSFSIVDAGDYTVSALANAPDDSSNSFFVNIDAEPTDPMMIWDVSVTSGLIDRTVSWRGNGTPQNNQFAPKIFTLAAGTHQLIVRGREANCQLSTITITPRGGTPAPTGDTTAPIISLTAPVNSATVTGSAITVSANASDNVGVAGVQFKLDGANLGAEDTSAPYSVSWNTTTVADGSHALTAVARDAAGNQTTTAPITVAVSNSTSASVPTVAITSSDPTMTEGTTDLASFTLTRTGSTASGLTVTLRPTGTATKWVDYRRPVQGDMPDVWTIPAGAYSLLITVKAVDDGLVEATETATMTIQPSANYTVGTPSNVTLTILDRASVSLAALSLNHSLSGTADNGIDYNTPSTSVTNPASAPSATTAVGSPSNGSVAISGVSVPSSLRKASAESMLITWTSTPGKTYQVASKNGLTDSSWANLSGDITATDTTTAWTDTTTGASRQRFYVVYEMN